MINDYKIADKLVLKKQHPCGENLWEVVKMGIDIRLRCTKCGHIVIIPRLDLNKRIKKIIREDNV